MFLETNSFYSDNKITIKTHKYIHHIKILVKQRMYKDAVKEFDKILSVYPQHIDFLKKTFWISHSDPDAYNILDNLMREKNLDSIILCGFHEQMCVLSRPLGYHHINSRRPEIGPLGYHNPSRYKLYIEWNLTCPMPRENWREEQLLQRAKEKYKYIDILSIEK